MSDIRYSGGLSIAATQAKYGVAKIHKMSSNENPLGPSPLALAAVRESAAELHRYPERDDTELRELLAEFHGSGLTADHIFTAVSGVEVLDMIPRGLAQAGDNVIVPTPTFGWYVFSNQRSGVEAIKVPLDPETFAHDNDAILAAVNDRTRMVYLCNPHNPTGAITLADQMDDLITRLPERVILLSDQVYYHFVDHPDYPDTYDYVTAGKNVLVVHSFSKAYGLAGLRLGYAIGSLAIMERLRKVNRPFQQPKLAYAAARAALVDDEHVQKSVDLAREGIAFLTRELEPLGVRCYPSHGNFILLKPPTDEVKLSEALMTRGIMVRPTGPNGLPGHLRVTLGVPEANKALVAAMRDLI
jgi:histidinol-phosphate aminotransferase